MMTHQYVDRLATLHTARFVGFVTKVSPGFVEADGPLCTVGDVCEIEGNKSRNGDKCIRAEVVSIEKGRTVLIPFDKTVSVTPNAKVTALPVKNAAPVGDVYAGRLVNAQARPIDNQSHIVPDKFLPIFGQIMSPMERADPDKILQTGVKAIDGLLPIGRGQRLGIFAASGVGKTTLLKQLAMQIQCDRCVVCLVGERGREVEALWRELSNQSDANRYSCVVATSDTSATLRARAVYQAACLAEYWRSKGEHVLLMVDSVTRLAMALREIGLAAGAPPTQRAYTPNVFEALPRLVERCGGAKSGGSITAIMTVLSETDDVDDPIVEVMKSLLDGHIVLWRQLAELGHFPAIDVAKSVSRQSEKLMSDPHAQGARNALGAISTYEDARIMIESGIYKSGSNTKIDQAVALKEALSSFLMQGEHENCALSDTLKTLTAISGDRASYG